MILSSGGGLLYDSGRSFIPADQTADPSIHCDTVSHPFKEDQEIPRMDWEDFIRTVRVQILKTQTPESYVTPSFHIIRHS